MSQQFIPGDIAYIKFTGEAVGILQYHSGSNMYDVRMCVRRKAKGNEYIWKTFNAWELESEADRNLKRQQEMDDLAKAMRGAGVTVLNDNPPRGPSAPPHSHDNMPN